MKLASKKSLRQNHVAVAADPLRWRRQHDRIELVELELDRYGIKTALVDTRGVLGAPHRAVDTLEAMEAAGTITAEMRDAGERFRTEFRMAQWDSLQCAKLDRATLGGGAAHSPYSELPPSVMAERARARVWAQIGLVGGIRSPAGSCLWGVLGWGQSLSEWAATGGWSGRSISRISASGILVAALGVLAGEKTA